jgi:hypothetical protein
LRLVGFLDSSLLHGIGPEPSLSNESLCRFMVYAGKATDFTDELFKDRRCYCGSGDGNRRSVGEDD